jgi:hypothetical protein
VTAHYSGPLPEPMSREDEIWVLASILGLKPSGRHYAQEILAERDAERAIMPRLHLTPLEELLR